MQEREQQYKEIFISEYDRMYRAAYILLGDEDEAKDAVQDVFVRLWAGNSLLCEESLRAFLLTCVRNRCLNIIAQKKEQLRVKNEKNAVVTETAAAADISLFPLHSSLDNKDLIAAINSYIDNKLTPQTSRIIRMHYDEEQSYKEISKELGISLSAVNKHIVQGLRRLRSTFNHRAV